MKRSRPWWVLLLAVVIGLGLGFATTTSTKARAESQQELFQAVKDYLTEVKVPAQDMPKSVISVKRLPNGHHLVQMQMVIGVGWFEVWKEGGAWKVQGAAPPSE